VADKIALRLEEDHRAAVALLLVSSEWNVLAVCHLPSIFKALANSNRSASPSISPLSAENGTLNFTLL
jgi:hypothetical protein